MTEVYRFSETEMLFFALVLVRLTAFVVSWPVFGVETLSGHIKVLFATALSLMIFPTLEWSMEQKAALQSSLLLLVAREAFFGFSLGYLARLFFFVFRITGDMISQAMGLNAASVFNPSLGSQIGSVEQFYLALVSLFYLAVDGHHALLIGLVKSFQFFKPAEVSLRVSQFTGLAQLTQEVIELGVRFSAPVVVAILVVNLILGIVGKAVPQLNVLVTSFPITILTGLILMMVTIPIWFFRMDEFLALSTNQIMSLVESF
jgi:flagellar biosynthetic protein FliR